MTKSGLFGATAILAALIATPVSAQSVMQEPGAYAQHHPWANRYDDRYGRSGFWPGDVAAGIVGGAIGTADAIVSAPYPGDAYAYDRPLVTRIRTPITASGRREPPAACSPARPLWVRTDVGILANRINLEIRAIAGGDRGSPLKRNGPASITPLAG